ncbi:hypothetical protein BOW53_02930 [Solemya pervernicosa gill symbiont]|uniref:Uncharacterized protein n=1 Tax=Solemya pervernicosa gill symbiont TaxID=642797 RepID=A0A1T2L952_9GAMM|nr:DUF3486 family protein [Solemya pervernicosa gill symbiont]OOZ41648.1 hypothetical protein BOW53_02930 [Solemya pervernicosa gill symbiont]
MTTEHIDQLRRLRVLQALQRADGHPMGEKAILNTVRVDHELSPTLERVRRSLNYLGDNGLAQLLYVEGSEWVAAYITDAGVSFLQAEAKPDGLEIYHPSDRPEPAPVDQRGRKSTIETLPPEVKAWLDGELVRRGFHDYVELAELLKEEGYEISKSAVGRYGKRQKEQLKTLRQKAEMAKAAAQVFGADHIAISQGTIATSIAAIVDAIEEREYGTDKEKLSSLAGALPKLISTDLSTRKFQIEQAARTKALDEAAEAVGKAAQQQGLTADQAQFWREQVLGVK